MEGLKLTKIAPSTIPTDLTILRNMGMVVHDVDGTYTLHTEHTRESSASTSSPPPPRVVPLFIRRTSFERYVVQEFTESRALHRQDMVDIKSQLTAI